MFTSYNGLTPLDITAIVYVVLTLLGLWIIYRILKRIFRNLAGVWSKDNLFGSDQKTRLISLGIVALFFPTVFYSIGNAIIYFIGNFFVDLPRDLITNWQTIQSICKGYQQDFGFCAVQFSNGFIQAWTSALSDALNRFGPTYISYSKLVLMLAVWAGISVLLSSATADGNEKDGTHQTRLQLWLQGQEGATKQNFMFAVVLLIAGYLSIAAITAIPGLEETATPSENVSEAQLERQLEDAAKQTFDRIPGQITFSEVVVEPTAEPTVEPTTEDGSPSPAEEPDAPAASIKDQVSNIQREFWQKRYSDFLNDAKKQAESSRTAALSQYQASVIARKGTKETIQHFLDIGAWYRAELSKVEIQLATCRRVTEELDKAQISSVQSTSTDLSILSFETQRIQDLQRNQSEACQSRAFFEDVPERKGLGSDLGPFSYVASWLMQTESLALAQIVGLLGFGLLGSAVSSLVRGKQKRSPKQPLVNELATVVIRGATAAVVVFLAVKGGLAIFTSGDSNANSYVLLLTCLVAAVFSEDVWTRAHEWLINKEEEEELKKDNAPPAPPDAEAEIVDDTTVTTENKTGETDQTANA